MTKPYFAKYLPVEGEIQIKDWIRDSLGVTQIKTQQGLEAIQGAKHIQKVKLFLCSREFEFPCDIYCFGEKVWRKNCQSTACSECVKVIGEISPDATWVKEGDEFTGKEIVISPDPICPRCKSYTNNGFCPEESECEWDKRRIIIYIKGPCGHFH